MDQKNDMHEQNKMVRFIIFTFAVVTLFLSVLGNILRPCHNKNNQWQHTANIRNTNTENIEIRSRYSQSHHRLLLQRRIPQSNLRSL